MIRIFVFVLLLLQFCGCQENTDDLWSFAKENEFRYLHLTMIPFSSRGSYSHHVDMETGAFTYKHQEDGEHSGTLDDETLTSIKTILEEASFKKIRIKPTGISVDGDFPSISFNNDPTEYRCQGGQLFGGLPDGNATIEYHFDNWEFNVKIIEILKNQKADPIDDPK